MLGFNYSQCIVVVDSWQKNLGVLRYIKAGKSLLVGTFKNRQKNSRNCGYVGTNIWNRWLHQFPSKPVFYTDLEPRLKLCLHAAFLAHSVEQLQGATLCDRNDFTKNIFLWLSVFWPWLLLFLALENRWGAMSTHGSSFCQQEHPSFSC